MAGKVLNIFVRLKKPLKMNKVTVRQYHACLKHNNNNEIMRHMLRHEDNDFWYDENSDTHSRFHLHLK